MPAPVRISDEHLAHREERCPDCEINYYLGSEGLPRFDRRGQVRSCATCGGRGRIRLVTRHEIQVASGQRRRELLALLECGGGRWASFRETIDPMLRKGKRWKA